jgi:hypothetical protein
LILSFFPAFSPKYKPRKEQCYWFCDVILSTVRAACDGALIVKGQGFEKAGKFYTFSIQFSASACKLFIDAYNLVRTLRQGYQLGTRSGVTLVRESVHILVLMLAIPSSEARTCVVVALTHFAAQSPVHRQMVAEAGTLSTDEYANH